MKTETRRQTDTVTMIAIFRTSRGEANISACTVAFSTTKKLRHKLKNHVLNQQRNGIADDAYNSAYHQCSDDGGLVTAHSRFWRENNCSSCNHATSLGMYMYAVLEHCSFGRTERRAWYKVRKRM